MLLLVVSGFIACRPHGSIVTHVLSPRYMQRTEDPIQKCGFADLSGNGRQQHITAEAPNGTSSILRAYDHDGKLIFEHDTQKLVREITTLQDQKDGSSWLFYSYSEEQQIKLSAYQFDWHEPERQISRSYDSILMNRPPVDSDQRVGPPRLIPVSLKDLDGDGRTELVCKIVSHQTNDPRGLIVYDQITGREKWRLSTEANLTDVIVGDFDLNGSIEILVGSRVDLPGGKEFTALNRSGGWLAVIDPKGRILFSERQFQGQGEVRLASLWSSSTQKPYLYSKNNTWGPGRKVNSIVWLIWNGKRLVQNREYSTKNTFERSSEHANLAVFEEKGKPRILVVERGEGLIELDDQLEVTKYKCTEFVTEILGAEDIDLDGNAEVLVRSTDRSILVLDAGMRKRAELKDPFPNAEKVSAYTVGRGSGLSKGLVVCSDEQVIYYGYYPVQWYTLLWRFSNAHSTWLALVLLAGLIFAIWYVIYNWQSIYTIMPSLRVAVLYLSDDDRIMYCNPYFLELTGAPIGQKNRSLKGLSPTLSKMLIDFKSSGDKLQNHELSMGEDHMAGMYRVSFFYRRNPVYRFLIIIIPVPTVNAAEKILWADTARRLSHHVRRHITNVILALPKLTDENVDASERKEYHQIISSEVEKIRVFTHSFQRFSELRDHDLRQHDVIPLVEHVLDHLHIPEGVKQIRNLSQDPTPAFLDPIRFEEALANILNNALDAMPQGGYLQVTLKTVAPHESPKGSLTVLVEVEDSGKGIPDKYMEEIWKPFFTTKQSGTGIGLPESKKIVESMGGMITLHSEEGIGTTVSIWLRAGEIEG